MRGKHRIIVQNNRLRYDFEVRRNITIIRGDSATGHTTLINMIRQWANLGESSGIDLICDVSCRPLEGIAWKYLLKEYDNTIFFSDEDSLFIRTEEFASTLANTDNYFVLITRENLYNLPYSVEEIFGIRNSGKYQTTRRIYNELFRIYPMRDRLPGRPSLVITEDSRAGYQFFSAVCRDLQIACKSAEGKSNLFSRLQECADEKVCLIADGAAIGPEMDRLVKSIKGREGAFLYLPESFEWLILSSGMIDGRRVQDILKHPEDFIESREYISWERFFTSLLMEETQDSYLRYNKNDLGEAYFTQRVREAIMKAAKGLQEAFGQSHEHSVSDIKGDDLP